MLCCFKNVVGRIMRRVKSVLKGYIWSKEKMIS